MQDRFRYRTWFNSRWAKPEMIYGTQATYDNGCTGEGSTHHSNFQEVLQDRHCITMQCLGLPDKNGTLIYEGDIVYKQGAKDYKGNKMLSKITFSNDTASFSYCDENGSHDFRTATSLKMEIVGNIYENPELWEAKC